MKTIYTFLFWGFTFTLKANDTLKMDKVYQKIILDNTPLKPEERISKSNTPKLKELIRYISPQEIESKKVLFYELDNNYDSNPLFPRFVKYMLEDGNIIKLHTVKNIMAIMINDDFDIQNFEENAKRIQLKVIKTSKEAFLKF
ncbi:MAG TPA: hypothetical protein PLX60_07020 [Chitinophagales bacterium]|jgi:hypothetical protein|nr:hypothetical protein [Chitinophagales bacterium]